jgi:hypothetical protein
MVAEKYLICEKCGRVSLHRFGGLCPECNLKEREWKPDFKIFYSLIRELRNEKISKGLFILQWAREQRRQGITPQRGRFVRP